MFTSSLNGSFAAAAALPRFKSLPDTVAICGPKAANAATDRPIPAARPGWVAANFTTGFIASVTACAKFPILVLASPNLFKVPATSNKPIEVASFPKLVAAKAAVLPIPLTVSASTL